jgi:hypothetical protein
MRVADRGQAVPPPRGGRCVRAREFADRRHAGEPLSDYDTRLLDSHLAGCEACTAYVAQLEGAPAQETVPGGNEDPTRARVDVVEEESRKPDETAGPEQHDLIPHEHHERSTVDAMGKDKRRQVVGGTYAASKQRQLAYYGVFVAFVVVLFLVASFAVSELDKAPSHNPAEAPWAQPAAPQQGLGGFSTDNKGGVTRFQ